MEAPEDAVTSGLCNICQTSVSSYGFDREYRGGVRAFRNHHLNEDDFEQAAFSGCYICRHLWPNYYNSEIRTNGFGSMSTRYRKEDTGGNLKG
jgi:hypothetical protein